MSEKGEIARHDPHSDPSPQDTDLNEWKYNRKSFPEEVKEIIEEAKANIRRAVRKARESDD
jgi:hypothetical protein